MNSYITGSIIKQLREQKGLTQSALADMIGVTDRAISKWETAKGFPDISLIEPLSSALGVSVAELLSGEQICNRNRSFNMLRTRFYVCPICGNIIHSTGEIPVSCCGIALPPLEAEDTDNAHEITAEPTEDEHFITVRHEMTKTHFISFIAFLSSDRLQLVKLYPEGNAETRMSLRGGGYLYIYCNRHGLMKIKI